MKKEFNLSEKIYGKLLFGNSYIFTKDIREFIKKIEDENKDFEEDIIALIEINNYGKKDLIAKMRRLCKAHKEERDKLAGEKLI